MEILTSRRRRSHTLLMTVALVATGAGLSAQRPLEYEVKAAYISNFLKFVAWPPDALGPAGAAFPVCLIGGDSVARPLLRPLSGEVVADHPVVVRRLQDAAEAGGCRVVFVAGDQGTREAPAIVRRAPAALVIGESTRFLDEGGHINFVVAGGHVKFDINFTTTRASGLVVSSKLARVARSVVGSPNDQ